MKPPLIRPFVALVAVLVLFVSCKKEEEKPVEPVIEFKSISATKVTQFTNEIKITFSYEDMQGDLGQADPDAYSLRVQDDRLEDFDWYHIPPMTPDMQELHIKGDYVVTLTPLFLLGSGGNETTRFTLQLRDRAGNWSNQIITPVVTISQ
ncbi:MAG: hypothetical protein ACK5W1_05050 [Flavobacteriales bacterium]